MQHPLHLLKNLQKNNAFLYKKQDMSFNANLQNLMLYCED